MWPGCIGCLKLQISFCKRATNFRALWRKTNYQDKACYVSSPLCTEFTVPSEYWIYSFVQKLILYLLCDSFIQKPITAPTFEKFCTRFGKPNIVFSKISYYFLKKKTRLFVENSEWLLHMWMSFTYESNYKCVCVTACMKITACVTCLDAWYEWVMSHIDESCLIRMCHVSYE